MRTRTDTPSAHDDPARFEAALARFQQDAEAAVNQAHADRLAHIQAIRDPIERMRAILDYHQNPGKDPTRPHPTKPEQRVRKGTKHEHAATANKPKEQDARRKEESPAAGNAPQRQNYVVVRPPVQDGPRMGPIAIPMPKISGGSATRRIPKQANTMRR